MSLTRYYIIRMRVSNNFTNFVRCLQQIGEPDNATVQNQTVSYIFL